MFDYTPRQKELLEMVQDFGQKYIYPNKGKFDNGEMPEDVKNAWFKLGFGSFIAPKEVGGMDLDAATVVILFEELGRMDSGLATLFGTNNLGSYPLLIAGTPEQQKNHFEQIISPTFRIATFGLTEPGAGSDAGAVATEAVREGDEYVLNGTKCYITSSGYSIDTGAYLSIFASTDKSKGSKGLTAFTIKGGTPGLTVSKVEDKLGIRGSQTCELVLENVRIPASSRLGEEGQGMSIAMQTLDSGRLVVGAQAVGAAQRSLDLAIEYAKNRMDGAKTLGTQQVVSFKIGEMAAKVEAVRALVRRGAVLEDAHVPYSIHSAKAKLLASEVAMEMARDAMEIMGYTGYSEDNPLEMHWRDSRILPIYEGTNQIQRMIIGNSLVRPPKK